MTKARIALLGAAMALTAGIGAASAQSYYSASRPLDEAEYYQRTYDRATGRDLQPASDVESVIVHPYYQDIEKRQMTGRFNGEINPTAYSLSRAVDFSDLDLSRSPDRAELRIRVHETAQDLCAQLEDRVPSLRGDRSASRSCVREASRQAMRAVMERMG